MMASINSAANLAMATKSQLAGLGGSADIMTSMTLGWNLDKTEKGFSHMADVLTKVVNGSKTSLLDLGESMKYVMGTGNHLNAGFEETAAAAMMLSNMGMRGSVSGVAMDNLLKFSTRAAAGKIDKKQGRALAMLGLAPTDLIDAKGDLIAIGEILQKIQTGSQKIPKYLAENARHDIFGTRGMRVLPIADHLETYYEFLNKLKQNDGIADKQGKMLMNTEEGQLDVLKDNWLVAINEFGTAITPIFAPMVKMLTVILNVMTAIVSNPLGKILATLVTGFIMLKTVTMAYQAVTLTLALMQNRLGVAGVTAANNTTSAVVTQTTAENALAASLALVAAETQAVAIANMQMTQSMTRAQRASIQSAQAHIASGAIAAGTAGIGAASLAAATRSRSGIFGRIGRGAGKFLGGNGMMIGMLGGMALNSASSSAGGNTTKTGVGLGIAGDTLQWAGTGAMVGSMFGPLGTVIGGVVGGVGALAWSLKTRLTEYDDSLKEAAKDIQSSSHKIDTMNLKKRLAMLDRLRVGGTYGYNNEDGSMYSFQGRTGNGAYNEKVERHQTIAIYIDGKQAMQETLRREQLKEIVNLNYR